MRHPARAAVPGGRGVLHRHGGRDHRHPLGGSHPDRRRQGRPHHRIAAERVLRSVLRQDRRQVGLARLCRHVRTARRGIRLMARAPQTLFEKVWQRHLVCAESAATPAVLYIDLHLVHEVTSPQAFTLLRERGLPVRRPERTLATMDHSTPTTTAQVFGGAPITIDAAARQVRELEANCAQFGVELLGLTHGQRGIVHVIGPELGLTQPGKTIVCGDSHTSTHGALGALAFGIGTSEVEHVLATQCLLQPKPRIMNIRVEGTLAAGVTAKDVALYIIGKLGTGIGTGYVIEYSGSAIRALSMEERMTICNMSIEAGARAGMIAPDETTYAYLS